MSTTALALLDNQRATGAQVFGQIMGVMDSVNQTAQQTAQMTLAVASKGFEMKETARMNDAQLASMQFSNELSAKRHEADMQLMPLKVETQRLQLEMQKTQAERVMKDSQMGMFNDVVAPYNARVGATFAKNQDPGYAKDFLGIQEKWRNYVARGGSFDGEAFGRDVDALDRNYQGATPKGDYNPEVSFLLGELGASSEKARYEAKNPVFKANLLAVRSSAITGGPEGLARLTGSKEVASMFTEDETRSLIIANQAYGSLDEQIAAKEKELSRFNTHFASMADNNPAKQGIGATLEASMVELTSLRQQRMNLLNQALDGKPIDLGEQVQKEDAIGEMVRRNIAESQERAKLLPDAAKPGEDKKEIINKQSYGLPETVSNFPEAMSGIPFQHVRGLDLERQPIDSTAYSTIKTHIAHNLNQVRDIGSLFQGESNKAKLQSIFDRYKDRSSTFVLPQNDKYEQPGIDIGITIGDGGLFESLDELEKWMGEFEGTENQRRLFQQDVYTSLMMADVLERSRPNARLPLLD
jgi:hypothetical protein